MNYFVSNTITYKLCLIILKIFSIQIMYSTDVSGSNFHHPGTGDQHYTIPQDETNWYP